MIFDRETSDPRLIPDILPIVHLGLDQVICIPRRRLARVKESVSEPMKKVVIIGAAGRDFHNFNIIYRNNPEYHVVAFTAAQIPGIEGRTYPPILSGSRYPKGIPIYAERELARIKKETILDLAFSAYADLSSKKLRN